MSSCSSSNLFFNAVRSTRPTATSTTGRERRDLSRASRLQTPATTSIAFHITARAERACEDAALLTDSSDAPPDRRRGRRNPRSAGGVVSRRSHAPTTTVGMAGT